jgi:hypothetical protein
MLKIILYYVFRGFWLTPPPLFCRVSSHCQDLRENFEEATTRSLLGVAKERIARGDEEILGSSAVKELRSFQIGIFKFYRYWMILVYLRV